MKRILIIALWPMLTLFGSGCIGGAVLVNNMSVVGTVFNFPHPAIYGHLMIMDQDGVIVSVEPPPIIGILVPESGVWEATRYAIGLSFDVGAPYDLEIIAQPNGFTCSFDNPEHASGTYGDMFSMGFHAVSITCVED